MINRFFAFLESHLLFVVLIILFPPLVVVVQMIHAAISRADHVPPASDRSFYSAPMYPHRVYNTRTLLRIAGETNGDH